MSFFGKKEKEWKELIERDGILFEKKTNKKIIYHKNLGRIVIPTGMYSSMDFQTSLKKAIKEYKKADAYKHSEQSQDDKGKASLDIYKTKEGLFWNFARAVRDEVENTIDFLIKEF